MCWCGSSVEMQWHLLSSWTPDSSVGISHQLSVQHSARVSLGNHTSSQFLWTVDVIYGQKLTWNNREWQFKRILDNLAKFKYQCKGQLSLIFLLQLMKNDSARTEELINGASQMEACVPTDWPEKGHKKSLLRTVSAPREKALGILFPSAGWRSVWFYSISRHSRTVACKCQYPL